METATLKAPTAVAGNDKVITMTKESPVINVSAEKLWDIIGPGFGEVGKWSRAVDHATTSGSSDFEGAPCSDRVCDVNAAGFNKIDEKLTDYNHQGKTLTYKVNKGMPGFVNYAANRWHVHTVGENKSKITMNVTMHLSPVMGTLMGWMLKRNLNSLLPGVMDDLKIYAETGKPSKTKLDRMKKLGQV